MEDMKLGGVCVGDLGSVEWRGEWCLRYTHSYMEISNNKKNQKIFSEWLKHRSWK